MTTGTLLKIERFDFCHFLTVCLLDANHNIETSFQIFDGRDLWYLLIKVFMQGKSLQLRIVNFSAVTFPKNCQKTLILYQSGGHPLKPLQHFKKHLYLSIQAKGLPNTPKKRVYSLNIQLTLPSTA